jgi:phosphoglycerate kinase
MVKRVVSDLNVEGKRVLVRVDFNVPIEQGVNAIATYDQRLRATLPTIRYLTERNCRVILCSHLGRPGGEVFESLRLAPVGDRLAVLLGRPVRSLPDCVGENVQTAVGSMEPGDITLLENLRFYVGEEQNAPAFAGNLASLADYFVMDAFAVAHRTHASTVGIPGLLPSAMGFLLQKEVEALSQALEAREERKPLAALMGGAKVSDKILVLENLLDKLDHLFVGGGMSVTFLRALGYGTGASSVEDDRLDFAREILGLAQQRGTQVYLPLDVVIADRFEANPLRVLTVPVNQVLDGWFIMDIGDSTARRFSKVLGQCKTIVWNGPMGVFEMPRFSQGTRIVAEAIAGLQDAISVVGGGSTAEAVEKLGLLERMTHVSTGGGASLEYLEGQELPGIAALPDA